MHPLLCVLVRLSAKNCTRYFSVVFSATKALPHHMGVASGTSMALFGFSPLVISLVANRFFTHPTSGLDVTHFLGFLAAAAGISHLFGALCMQGPEPKHANSHPNNASEDEESQPPTERLSAEAGFNSDDEARPLLDSNKPVIAVDVIPVPEPQHGSVGDLLRDPYFWMLFSILTILIGGVRMIKPIYF